MNLQVYRQGDVAFVRVKPVEDWDKSIIGSHASRQGDWEPDRDFIVARGEVTGHNHTVAGVIERTRGPVPELADNKDRVSWNDFYTRIRVAEPVDVVHIDESGTLTGEHDTITLPVGEYAVYQQREYTPFRTRKVYD